MMRAFMMLLCFALAGLNVWVIATGAGGPLNYIAVPVALGGGVASLISLVKYP